MRLAEEMKGALTVESEVDRGTVFHVTLPRSEGHGAHEPVAPHAVIGTATYAGSVLYIEDNPSNIAFMQDLLADYRVDLQVAPTAEIGLELVRSSRPHVVIMDVNLPGMSGIAATKFTVDEHAVNVEQCAVAHLAQGTFD